MKSQCEGLVLRTPMQQRTDLAFGLGARLSDPLPGSTNLSLATVAFDRTGVDDPYATGDVSTSIPPSVATAITRGSTTPTIVVHDLLLDMCPTGDDGSAPSRGVA